MRMKRWGLLACTLLVTALLTNACSSGGNNAKKPEGESGNGNQTVDTSPLGKYDPPIEVTAVRPISEGMEYKSGESLDNNAWSRAYEADLGIKIKYLWTTPDAQYAQKINIAIASDDMPNIAEVNAAQLKRLIEDDQLQDLTSVYEQYASPLTKKILSEDGGNAIKSSTFDGKMYAIPKMGSGIGQSQVLWIRTDWLKKLNLEEPKTMQDVLAIAEAFAKKDPDGNGAADTYGLGVNKDLWGFYAGLEGFFNGFHAYPNIWVKDASGKLVYGSVQPEMKQALQKLQEMYATGVLNKEFGTRDASKVNEDANAGKVGMFFGFFWNSGWLQDGKTNNPDMEWKAIEIPSIDGEAAKSQVPFAISTYYTVKKGSAHPEAAVKMLNLALEKIYGETAEPEIYNVDKDGMSAFSYTLLYGEAPRKNLDAMLHIKSALEANDPSSLNLEEKGYYDNIMNYRGGDRAFWSAEKMYGPEGSLSVLDAFMQKGLTMDNQFFGAPTQTMVDREGTLQKQQVQTFTSIIMGGSIDQFDAFVSTWNKQGGEQMTKEVNDWSQN
ncbi:extracellular solute-binding protein [Paenibacillus radicis (ex Gao et al. 2016)]|uniref:Lipoprotein LipO n=1 Tax=Paenibacillus radicis (ex Gao et al. 2016) TaxID=1737354 RepID=A0A917M5C6_9BACL|nr:extracellular solute-binding protein [Paenibacillus radicis (ex Gao et al. 2016)]GGG79028.1 lipoprotein LipO [Paenibacillus radicis (ex Gao et al. 2016)]